MIDILKVVFLFFSVFFTMITMHDFVRKCDIPLLAFFFNGAAITGFVRLQWLI